MEPIEGGTQAQGGDLPPVPLPPVPLPSNTGRESSGLPEAPVSSSSPPSAVSPISPDVPVLVVPTENNAPIATLPTVPADPGVAEPYTSPPLIGPGGETWNQPQSTPSYPGTGVTGGSPSVSDTDELDELGWPKAPSATPSPTSVEPQAQRSVDSTFTTPLPSSPPAVVNPGESVVLYETPGTGVTPNAYEATPVPDAGVTAPPVTAAPVPNIPVAIPDPVPVPAPPSMPETANTSTAPSVVATLPSEGSIVTPQSQMAPTPKNMKVHGFGMLVDLSSSMLWLSPCVGGLDKAEAESILIRKMTHRIPRSPFVATLRVFGYKNAWREVDYTTLYYGPKVFNPDDFETAVSKLMPANAISPFGVGMKALTGDLAAMDNPRVVLMFSDFEVFSDPGDPPGESRKLLELYGSDTKVYTFYVTKVKKAVTLANQIALTGGGKSYNVCSLLSDDTLFEDVMDEIFGPMVEPPCSDIDADGVCDERDKCPQTPKGAPVDGRGCWIAAYSQFFDFDKTVVKSEFHPRLQYAAEIISQNTQIPLVIIAGHTDSKGTDQYNMDLGKRRAEAVKTLLIKFGAPVDRLSVESFGKTRPIDTNDTDEGRARNRRVEFHVGEVPPDIS
jgi:OOP family OmpA-OmpF porin